MGLLATLTRIRDRAPRDGTTDQRLLGLTPRERQVGERQARDHRDHDDQRHRGELGTAISEGWGEEAGWGALAIAYGTLGIG